jgi:hypothetical protein
LNFNYHRLHLFYFSRHSGDFRAKGASLFLQQAHLPFDGVPPGAEKGNQHQLLRATLVVATVQVPILPKVTNICNYKVFFLAKIFPESKHRPLF